MLLMPVAVIYAKKPKVRNERIIVVSPVLSEDATYSVDSIQFKFGWKSYKDFGIDVTISNDKDSCIFVEWNNVRLGDEPICFGTDNSFTYTDKKYDEIVYDGSYTKKFIAKQSQFNNIEFARLFHWDIYKKEGRSAKIEVIIPIKSMGKTTVYRIKTMIMADIE